MIFLQGFWETGKSTIGFLQGNLVSPLARLNNEGALILAGDGQ